MRCIQLYSGKVNPFVTGGLIRQTVQIVVRYAYALTVEPYSKDNAPMGEACIFSSFSQIEVVQ